MLLLGELYGVYEMKGDSYFLWRVPKIGVEEYQGTYSKDDLDKLVATIKSLK